MEFLRGWICLKKKKDILKTSSKSNSIHVRLFITLCCQFTLVKNTWDDKLCSLLEETSGLKLCAEEYRVMLHPALWACIRWTIMLQKLTSTCKLWNSSILKYFSTFWRCNNKNQITSYVQNIKLPLVPLFVLLIHDQVCNLQYDQVDFEIVLCRTVFELL